MIEISFIATFHSAFAVLEWSEQEEAAGLQPGCSWRLATHAKTAKAELQGTCLILREESCQNGRKN
jgi:hypothetical protein